MQKVYKFTVCVSICNCSLCCALVKKKNKKFKFTLNYILPKMLKPKMAVACKQSKVCKSRTSSREKSFSENVCESHSKKSKSVSVSVHREFKFSCLLRDLAREKVSHDHMLVETFSCVTTSRAKPTWVFIDTGKPSQPAAEYGFKQP